jgi:RNA polymerase sigma factor (sigma-70 family)
MTHEAAPQPLDALLARREWVRRFARTLSRDDASADDLAQDAWVAAVERTPRPDAPAGWFRRVLTRRAIDVSRETTRRGRREGDAARPEATAATADVVAAAESHRRVVEAVMALDEPYRSTVLLRFFEDLPPREVAARMGVPVETVRARVRRAVEKLRARLDEEHGGRRAAWLAPLLAGGPDEAAPARPATGGGLVLTTTQKSVAAAALVALLFGGAWIAASSGERRTDDDAGATASADDAPARPTRRRRRAGDAAELAPPATPTPAAAPAASPREPDPPVPADDAAPDHFDVYVVDPSHAPVDGAPVRIEVMDMGFQPVSEQDLSAVTDERGHARFKVGSRVKSASVAFSGSDGRPWRPGAPWFATGPAERCELVVERAAWIAGRVLLEDGSSAAGLGVAAVDPRGRRTCVTATEFDGRFKLIVPRHGPWDVVLDESGTGRTWTTVAPRKDAAGKDSATKDLERPWEFAAEARGVAPGTTDVELTATRRPGTRTLRVRTVTAAGRPIPDASVRVQRRKAGWTEALRTDADGRASISDVPDRRAVVQVGNDAPDAPAWERDGWATPLGPFYAPPGEDEFVIVFDAGRAVRGRVEAPEGFEPVKDVKGRPVRAAVSIQDKTTQRSWTCHADADGRFTAVVAADAAGPLRAVATWSGVGAFLMTSVDDVRPDAGDVVIKLVPK